MSIEEPEEKKEIEEEEHEDEGLEDFDLSCFTDEELYEDGFDYGDEEDINILNLLCFKLADEEYAINIMNMKEIVKLREFTEVPRAPEFISGIISLRGIIIPVFDLRKRLGLDVKEYGKDTRIIIATDQSRNWGMIVDEVIQVIRMPEDNVEPPPSIISGISAEFISGIGKFENKFVIIMNLKNVLDIDI
jgi:purine-binding chemotaxis protein CheW